MRGSAQPRQLAQILKSGLIERDDKQVGAVVANANGCIGGAYGLNLRSVAKQRRQCRSMMLRTHKQNLFDHRPLDVTGDIVTLLLNLKQYDSQNTQSYGTASGGQRSGQMRRVAGFPNHQHDTSA
ncbi:MAG TPA: hypothetical protein PK808_06270 [Polymorphobacter sp.]|nr:hypothetical protein [Polymorphobacter sp.]